MVSVVWRITPIAKNIDPTIPMHAAASCIKAERFMQSNVM